MKMRNNIIKISLILFALCIFFVSCDNEIKGIAKLELDKDEITISELGGEEKVLVTSSEEWVAQSSEPWVMITPANGFGNTECSIVIDSTLINDMRTAKIRFKADGQNPQTITVRQTGFEKMIVVEEPEIEIEASEAPSKRNFSTKVTTNIEFKIEVEYEGLTGKWLEPNVYEVELDRGARPRTTDIKFDWKINPDPAKRIAKVKFVPTNSEDILKEPVVIEVTQKAAPKIEDNRAGDSLAILMISEKLQSMNLWDSSENLRNWKNVILWEKTDKDLPTEEAIGRIKEVGFTMANTKESLPQEFRYLKYLETLAVYSNSNTMLLSINLGPEITDLEYLKHLQIAAYGLVSIPNEFIKLGDKLETLDLSSNNFTSIPSILTPANFPKLTSLSFTGNRRWNASDLRTADTFENGIGMHINTENDNSIKNLLLWENLEELRLSFNYIEGKVPDFKINQDGVSAYDEAKDAELFGGDTIKYLANGNIPKILPNMKRLSINLNFFDGKAPEWLMYHPRLMEWGPDILIFNQMEYGINSNGKVVKFDNQPSNYDYHNTFFKTGKKILNSYE